MKEEGKGRERSDGWLCRAIGKHKTVVVEEGKRGERGGDLSREGEESKFHENMGTDTDKGQKTIHTTHTGTQLERVLERERG